MPARAGRGVRTCVIRTCLIRSMRDALSRPITSCIAAEKRHFRLSSRGPRSDNGRYLIRGTAYDLWHGAELTSLAQADDLGGRIDLTRLTLDPADLGALDTGIAQRAVVTAQLLGVCGTPFLIAPDGRLH